MTERLVHKGLYRHFKGKYYNVIGIHTDVDDGRDLVIYVGENGLRWAREKSDFLAVVETSPNTVYRFELVEIDDGVENAEIQ